MPRFWCIASNAKHCASVILSALLTVISHSSPTGPTQAHDNAVTESPRMSHQSLGIHQEVFKHLRGLRILKRYVFSLTPSFIELLMQELSEQSPLFSMLHNQDMVASGDEIMGDIGRRAIAVDGRFLVNEGFNNATIRDYNRGCWTKLERNYGTVFLGPFCES